MPANVPMVRASIILALKRYADTRNFPIDELLGQLGVKTALLNDPLEEIPFETVVRALELAAGRSGDRCFGLHLAMSFPPGGTVPLGNMALSAPTVRAAVESVANHIGGYMGGVEVDFRIQDGSGRLSWRLPTFSVVPVQYNIFGAALIVARIRVAAGASWVPDLVEFDHEELPCAAEMAQVFGRAIRFNRPRNLVLVGKQTLDLPMPTADPGLHAELVRLAQQRKALVTDAGIVDRVVSVVGDRLSKSQATLDRVAAALGLTPRSLQWQLEQAGTTFERIVNDTRRTRAEHLLANTDMPLIDIAFDVGFSDPSAFTRAGRRWFGVSPKEYRRARRGAPKPPRR